jgi:hypothetical protein
MGATPTPFSDVVDARPLVSKKKEEGMSMLDLIAGAVVFGGVPLTVFAVWKLIGKPIREENIKDALRRRDNPNA